MLSPARPDPDSTDGDDTSESDLAPGQMHDGGDEDRGEPRSKRARTQERRAMQACFRCRRQKLRCLGGRPCARCVKANTECDFANENTGNIAHPPNAPISTPQPHEQQGQQERRAMQACFRCRRQKLRCLGGKPCARCVKTNNECDFGNPGQPLTTPKSSTNTTGKVVADGAGLEQLESHAVNLLAGLHESSFSGTEIMPANGASPAPNPATTSSIALPATQVVAPVATPAPAPAAGVALLPPGPPSYDNTSFTNTTTPDLLSTSGPLMTPEARAGAFW